MAPDLSHTNQMHQPDCDLGSGQPKELSLVYRKNSCRKVWAPSMQGQRCSMAQMQHLPSGGSSIFPVLPRWYDQSSSRLHSLHTWFFNHHGDSVNYPTSFLKIPFWLKSASPNGSKKAFFTHLKTHHLLYCLRWTCSLFLPCRILLLCLLH